ncbi:Phox-like protein [Polychaeton citri CBS 116435]|uniref:Phox-like protein n=1 Tax=Polychaeton citri CBS 116435 TaxID=1314669 RepID=A0A9P4QCP9_9PEZI|nr:Phox-like protein [Polychaeton citri CBS 116435]
MPPNLSLSIPTASTTTPSDGKPFTQYHIVLQLPLRKHEAKKRYNDFVALNDALTQQTGQPPPVALPGKSWLRRTVNSEALTEERRQGLEKYVRSIIESEDPRWRSSSVWRQFLDLPAGLSTINANGELSSASTSQSRRASVGGAITDPNDWLDVHRELKGQIQTARTQLKQREQATTAASQHSLSAEAKATLIRAASNISQLEEGLKRISAASRGDDAGWGSSKKLGDGEIRRRRDLLGAARKEVEGLEGLLRSMATRNAKSSSSTAAPSASSAAATTADKEALWKGTSAATPKPSGRVLGGPLKETEKTRELDNKGVLQLQKQVMQEQDEDVMELGKTVNKLRDMGILINEELGLQNEMLGLIDQDVDRVQGKVDVARARIKKIS